MRERLGFSDYDIQALVDGELDDEQEKLVRMHIEGNDRALQRYQELKEQRQLLKRWGGDK